MMGERVISIRGREVFAHVGVPEGERLVRQRLLIDLRFASGVQPPDLNDDLDLTVDYAAVSQRVADIVEEYPRRLIETLADELGSQLLEEFSLRWIEVTIRKFILPQTEWVSVSIRREKNGEKSES
jgi:FolB domain-containing protein